MDDAIQGKPRIIVGVPVVRVVEFKVWFLILNFFLFLFFLSRGQLLKVSVDVFGKRDDDLR